MEDQWRETQKRIEAKKQEHRNRLNTPALYAIEVYCQVFTLEGVSPIDFEDDDIRIRYKFLDYACVEMEKSSDVGQSGPTSTGTSSSPLTSTNSPGTPGTPKTPVSGTATPATPAADPVEGKVEGQTPSAQSQPKELKADSGNKPAAQEVPEVKPGEGQEVAASPAESATTPSESASSPTSPSTKRRDRKRDPRYFDPKALLKPNPPPITETLITAEAPTTQPGDALPETLTTEEPKEGLKADSKKSQGSANESKQKDLEKARTGSTKQVQGDAADQSTSPDQSATTGVPDDTTMPPTEPDMTEFEEEFGEEESTLLEDHSNALFFENGKTLIVCTTPLNLLYSLPRYPLLVIFFRPPAEVFGIARVDLSGFAEAIDSSIILTKSIPLSAEKNNSFDIVANGRKVGWADLSVRLSCYGPFLLHRIYVKDNPNETSEEAKARAHRTNERLMVVQLSAANLGMVRHKSKLFVNKGSPSLVGRITRDISSLPPIVCADEHLTSPPPRPKPELTIVEEEEIENEKKRKENLSRFPQYGCVDDWEVVFNRQVIRDLIAKNRRPFQPGSPDRTYVESYFPELLPDSFGRMKSQTGSGSEEKKPTTKRKLGKKSSGDGPSLSCLDLDEEWMKENHLQRIRRKSQRPAVRTSIAEESENRPVKSVPSGSSKSKLPDHTITSMSHVAVNHFDMEKNDYSADSRVYYPPERAVQSRSPSSSARFTPTNDYLKNASNVAIYHFNTDKKSVGTTQKRHSLDATSSRQFRGGVIFNTRHPRLDWSLEKFNPLPGRPYAIKLRAPERSPADKLVQALRLISDEVEAIGGDTKLLHNMYQDALSAEGSERYRPEHLKRGYRTTQTPDDASRILSATAEPVLIEVDKGVPLAVPVRETPYWEGHMPVCPDATDCSHYIFLHPGFGYYGR